VKVALSKTPPSSAHKCIKCNKVKELRDKVPGGAGLAQLLSSDLDTVLQINPNQLERSWNRLDQRIQFAMHKKRQQVVTLGWKWASIPERQPNGLLGNSIE
jgi:hypothetical protein